MCVFCFHFITGPILPSCFSSLTIIVFVHVMECQETVNSLIFFSIFRGEVVPLRFAFPVSEGTSSKKSCLSTKWVDSVETTGQKCHNTQRIPKASENIFKFSKKIHWYVSGWLISPLALQYLSHQDLSISLDLQSSLWNLRTGKNALNAALFDAVEHTLFHFRRYFLSFNPLVRQYPHLCLLI